VQAIPGGADLPVGLGRILEPLLELHRVDTRFGVFQNAHDAVLDQSAQQVRIAVALDARDNLCARRGAAQTINVQTNFPWAMEAGREVTRPCVEQYDCELSFGTQARQRGLDAAHLLDEQISRTAFSGWQPQQLGMFMYNEQPNGGFVYGRQNLSPTY
jgi:hypothetical protein